MDAESLPYYILFFIALLIRFRKQLLKIRLRKLITLGNYGKAILAGSICLVFGCCTPSNSYEKDTDKTEISGAFTNSGIPDTMDLMLLLVVIILMMHVSKLTDILNDSIQVFSQQLKNQNHEEDTKKEI